MGKFIQYSTKGAQYNGPFDSKVGWAAPGMGDLFVTDSGKLIAVDGGYLDDGERFVELLEKNAERAKAIIAAHVPLFSSKKAFLQFIDSMNASGDRIAYHEDGTATVRVD